MKKINSVPPRSSTPLSRAEKVRYTASLLELRIINGTKLRMNTNSVWVIFTYGGFQYKAVNLGWLLLILAHDKGRKKLFPALSL